MLRTLKALSVAVIAAWAAHALAWVVGLYLAFGPIYQGVSYSGMDESSSTLNPEEWTHYTETLIEVNGIQAGIYLLIPLLLTGGAVWIVHRADIGKVWRIVLIWILAFVLLGLCVMTLLSIGGLYLPAALALIIAAVVNSIAKLTPQR